MTHPRDVIVLRSSPDWLNFDMEETRAFCRRLGWRDDVLIRCQEMWDSIFAISYREFRAETQRISTDSFQACGGAEIATTFDIDAYRSENVRLYFTDDDDWFHPDIVAEIDANVDPASVGALWGSIYCGTRISTPEKRNVFVWARPLSDIVYTNNSMITREFLIGSGITRTPEHSEIDRICRTGSFDIAKIDRYLSCTNKHPASTTFIAGAARDRYELLERFRAYCSVASLRSFDEQTSWVEPYATRMNDLCSQTLATARGL